MTENEGPPRALPRPPWPVTAANTAWAGLQRLGIARTQLSEHSLIDAARRATGVHDFGADFSDPTCREALRAIAEARAEGLPVHGETCPHYLLLDDSVYDKPEFEGGAYVCAPPIRALGHQEALWKGLAAGTLETVGTDHCPFQMHQKEHFLIENAVDCRKS